MIHRSAPLSQQVHTALRQSIATGKFKPGERIVVEHVAEQLRVSPTPVREALNRLLQAGLISNGPGGKLQVVSLTPTYVTNTFFVRGALEGVAAELAAPRIQQQDISLLCEAMETADGAVTKNQYDIYTQADQYLHRGVRDAAGNSVLSQELRRLQVHVDFIRVYSRQHAGDHIRLSQQEHWRIVDALRSHDPQRARHLMEDHIRGASQRIVKLIDFDAHEIHTTDAARDDEDGVREPIWLASGKPVQEE